MSSASLLYAVVATPGGGDTLFADSTTAHDGLPAEVRDRIASLRAVHSMTYLFAEQARLNPDKTPLSDEQQAQVPDVEPPSASPSGQVTGCRSLLLGDMIISGIVGLTAEESAQLLDRLHAHAFQPRYVYRHQWTVGDLVIWDNRATMHTATPTDHRLHPRLLHRTTVL
jgi:taurine dioxygenase